MPEPYTERGKHRLARRQEPACLEIPDWGDFVDPVLLASPEALPAFVVDMTDPVSREPLYTYVGVDPICEPLDPGPPHAMFEQIERALPARQAGTAGLPPFQGGLVGFVGYDAARPDMSGGILRVDRLIAIDHTQRRGFYISHTACSEAELRDQIASWRATGRRAPVVDRQDPVTGEWHHSLPQSAYCAAVAAIKRGAEKGEVQQVVLSLELSRRAARPSYALYRALRRMNPAQQNFYLRSAAATLLGTPPSPYLRVRNGTCTLEIGAGTRRVTGRTDVDDRSADELRNDRKELAEHRMLVAQAAEDMRQFATAVDIGPMEVRRFSHVMHLFTELSGMLDSGSSALDALARAFPPGASTGTPREPARRAIARLEMMPRGPYGGVYFMIGHDRALDSAIIERSLWITNNEMHLRVGAGITADSMPETEYAECLQKAEALLQAIESVEGLS